MLPTSVGPASSRATVTAGSSNRRAASTQPADPPLTKALSKVLTGDSGARQRMWRSGQPHPYTSGGAASHRLLQLAGGVLGQHADLVAPAYEVPRQPDRDDRADEQHRAALQVSEEWIGGVVDLLARSDEVERHAGPPQHGEDVEGQAPPAEREVAVASGARTRPVPAQPGEQHRHRNKQVGDVDHDDRNCGNHTVMICGLPRG